MTTCPICSLTVLDDGRNGDTLQYSCVRCGNFQLSGSLHASLQSMLEGRPHGRAILSHAIREIQRKDEWPLITSYLAEQVLRERSLPKPAEQANNLLRWLGDTAEAAESNVVEGIETLQAIIGGQTPNTVLYIANHLANEGYIKFEITKGPKYNFQMTLKGWAEYDRLQRDQSESKTVFMAMKFGDEELNRVVEQVFRPAVESTGYTLRVLTDVPRAGLIDDRLRVEIRRSRFMLADITHGNLGAYWEAGFAEGLGKPVIYTCKNEAFRKGVSHFDTNHHLTVMWSDDLEPPVSE